MIRPVHPDDTEQIAAIYAHYVQHTIITFELQPPTSTEMQQRIENCIKQYPWLVYEENGKVCGYSYASKYKERQAYRFSVESSVYLHHQHTGKGIGSQLYKALLLELKNRGYATVVGGAALPNEASVKLHEKLGFEYVGVFKKVGYKFNKWINVAYWQLHLKDLSHFQPENEV